METNKLEAFRYKRGQLLVLDQLKLPAKHEYIDVKTVDEGWTVINTMQVQMLLENDAAFCANNTAPYIQVQ